MSLYIKMCGRDNVVSRVTRFRLDEVFRTGPGRPWEPPSLLYSGYGSLRIKRPVYAVDHPTPSSDDVHGRVELHLYPLWAFIACCRVNMTFTFT